MTDLLSPDPREIDQPTWNRIWAAFMTLAHGEGTGEAAHEAKALLFAALQFMARREGRRFG